MERIIEKDWKVLARMKDDLLNRACEEILSEIEHLMKGRSGREYETYLQIWNVIRKKDKDISTMFDDLRRSNAIMKILYMRRLGVIKDDELELFSKSTRERVNNLIEMLK